MAAVNGTIASRAVAAAIARPPHAPRLLEVGRLGRRLEDLAVRERDVVGQFLPLGRKADGAAVIHVASAIDERIEHDVEELIGELKASLLRPGRRFARKKRQRIGEIGAGEGEQRQERRRERRVVEEIIDGAGDGLMVRAQACRLLRSTKRSPHVQHHVRLGVTQDVPGAPEPGANVPPLLICVLPTVPVPLSTAPLFTVVRLELPLKPFTIRPPLLTTVVPV